MVRKQKDNFGIFLIKDLWSVSKATDAHLACEDAWSAVELCCPHCVVSDSQVLCVSFVVRYPSQAGIWCEL